MENIIDILEERNYIEQTIDKENLKELLSKESVPFYIELIQQQTVFM